MGRPRFVQRRPVRQRLAVVAVLAAGAAVGCGEARTSDDELYDFQEPTTSEVRAGTPYDTYVLLAEQAGLKLLKLGDADSRAQELCVDPLTVAGPRTDRSLQDAALIAAYCPEADTDS